MDYLDTLKKEVDIRIEKHSLIENRKLLVQNIIDKYNEYGLDFYMHVMSSINSYPVLSKRKLEDTQFCKL